MCVCVWQVHKELQGNSRKVEEATRERQNAKESLEVGADEG